MPAGRARTVVLYTGPVGTSRRPLRTAFIAALLLLQIALPLSYYLGEGGDDERFSWRMFSTTRVHRCRVDVLETFGARPPQSTRAVQPEKDVQAAWISMLRRNRPAVVERYLERRCALSDAARTLYRRRCVRSDGVQLPTQEVGLDCRLGTFQRREVP